MKKLIILLSIVALMGCSTIGKVVDQATTPLGQAVVKATTARVISDHPTWTVKILNITGDAVLAIDNGLTVSLDDVYAQLMKNIPWTEMQPEEQALVEVLISTVAADLFGAYDGTGVDMQNEQMLKVRDILVWINETAGLRI